MTFSGWIATLAGWYVTEIGRQPYLVSGVLRTAEAVTAVSASNVAMSLTIYLSLYGLLLHAYLRTLFVMSNRAVKVEEFETSSRVDNVGNIGSEPRGHAVGLKSKEAV